MLENAVKTFEPYKLAQEPNEGARTGMVEIVKGTRKRKMPAFLFVNNRLEGNALGTSETVVEGLQVHSSMNMGIRLALSSEFFRIERTLIFGTSVYIWGYMIRFGEVWGGLTVTA